MRYNKFFGLLILFAFSLIVGSSTAFAQTFSAMDITGDTGASQDALFLDVDGDSDLDIYVPNGSGEQNKLWINDGAANFIANDIPGDTGNSNHASAGDVDNDGDLDIYVGNNGANRLWINDGTANFTSMGITGDFGNSYGVAMGDFNSDGNLDIYVTNYNRQNKLWMGDGTGAFIANDISGDRGYSRKAVAGDIDGDGDLDIYVANTIVANQNKLWINDGTANFTSMDITGDLGNSYGVAMGDVDNDGDNDLYAGNSGQNKLWINDGTTNFTANDISGDGSSSYEVLINDIDGDGNQDIFSTTSGQNRLWMGDGTGSFTANHITGDAGTSYGVDIGDLNGDGLLDVYVANRGAQNKLWLQDVKPDIVITAPTKLNNTSITDTTIVVTDALGVLAANISVDGASTTTTSSLNCVQTTALQVDCTISVDSSGDLTITATNTSANSNTGTETNYIVDTIGPVPLVSIDTITNGVDMPIFTFSATDNVAVDHFEITYNTDNGAVGVGAPTTDTPVTSPLTLTLDPDEVLHSVTIRTYDTAGNFTDSLLLFPPTINFTQPTAISNVAITDSSFTVTSATGNDLDNISITANGTGATLGTCTGFGGDLISPYASPVTCSILGVTATGTINVNARDSINLATGQNNLSYIIDTTDPTAVITAPLKSDNEAITNTTVKITDDIRIDANDVSISAVNTVDGFSVSNLMCSQTTATQVDCTLQIDGNTGTGDLVVSYTDVAGNSTSTNESGYVIDATPPATPSVPNLQSGSDTGILNTDNLTSDNTPSFDVVCSENDSTINLYSDHPVPGTLIGTHACSSIGTETATVSPEIADAVHNISYSETDSFNNESGQSPSLTVTVDTTISNPVINVPTTGTPVSGTAEANSTITITTPSGATCSTTADGGGNYSCNLLPAPTNGENITATAVDQAGNSATTTENSGIDTAAPISPTVDPTQAGDTTITGTGENGTTITLDIGTCTNAPVIVAGGVWSCDIAVLDAPDKGDTITATSTDAAGNFSTGSYRIPNPSSGGGSVKYVCRDTSATNYSKFGRHKQSKCKYNVEEIEPTQENPFGGEQCSSDLIIHDNMKNGDTNGRYSSYNKGIVTEISILQAHINRLLIEEYGPQAAGPVDDYFRELTHRGVERLQKRLNILLEGKIEPLVIDGIVGPFTRAAINMSC